MKTIITLAVVLAALTGCKKELVYPSEKDNLITPQLLVTESGISYNGTLDVYPCYNQSSIYFGNYHGTDISLIAPVYLISDGEITASQNPIRLPIGTYNFVYWGESQLLQNAYRPIGIRHPAIVEQVNLDNAYYSLRKYSGVADTAYLPTLDYVYAVKQVALGSDPISVELNRVVAGLTVSIKQENGAALDASIADIDILIGGMASRMNVYTAQAEDFTKTVRFALTISDNRMEAANTTAMVFPTTINPPLTVVLKLTDGKQLLYNTYLNNKLVANTNLKLDITLGPLLVEESTGNGFQVTQWNEQNETINTGPVS